MGCRGGDILTLARPFECIGRSGELSDFVGEAPSEPDVVGFRLRLALLDTSPSGRKALSRAASTSCSGSAAMETM